MSSIKRGENVTNIVDLRERERGGERERERIKLPEPDTRFP